MAVQAFFLAAATAGQRSCLYLDRPSPAEVAAQLTGLPGVNRLCPCRRFWSPPKRGGKIRPFNMIRRLPASANDVMACWSVRSSEKAEEARGIEPYCARFEMRAGERLLVADAPQEIAKAMLRMRTRVQSQEWRRLAIAGWLRMLIHHAWPRSLDRADRIADRALPPRGAFAS